MSPEIRELIDLEIAVKRRAFDESLRRRQLEAGELTSQWIREFLLDEGIHPGRCKIFEKSHQAFLKVAVGAIEDWSKLAWQAVLNTLDAGNAEEVSEAELHTILDQYIGYEHLVELGLNVADAERIQKDLDISLSRYGLRNLASEEHFARRFQLSVTTAELQIRHVAESVRQKLRPAIKKALLGIAELEKSDVNQTKRLSSDAPSNLPSPGPARIQDCIPYPPQKKNDWYYAIQDCVTEFLQERGRCPQATEIWSRLRTNPPNTYGITNSKSSKKDSVEMDGNALSRSSFLRRWKNWTSD